MTPAEWAGLTTLVATCGALLLGMWRIVAAQSAAAKLLAAENKKKDSVPPPVDHGPCNVAVDRMTDAMGAEIEEQKAFRGEFNAFRLAFERYLAREEGRRDALRATGEHPVTG